MLVSVEIQNSMICAWSARGYTPHQAVTNLEKVQHEQNAN
jgi:hypothetical protein